MAFEMPGVADSPRIPNRIGLIDADCVAYWGAAGCDEMTRDAAHQRVDNRMAMIIDQIQTDEIRCYLTGSNNFRERIATYQQYKGNRYDANGNRLRPQPKWLHSCRQYLVENYGAVLCDGQEADDALAIAQVKCNASRDWHSIISSIDKDLRIVAGLHHDMNSGIIIETDALGGLEIDAKGKLRGTGMAFFYAQLLMGDSADWIPGLPKVTPWMKETFEEVKRLGGCGPKAAYGVLHDAKSEEEMYGRVLACYESYWDGDHWYEHWQTGETIYPEPREMLIEQGRLLWMRHYEGELWDPPVPV
jgi:5'-3' exonuclease